MNRKIISLFMGAAMAVTGVIFTSCGGDDDGYDIKPADKVAKIAAAQPVIYFAEDMLDIYDITCTVDGETVTLTKNNTENSTYTDPIMKTQTPVLKYTSAQKTFATFPATMNVTAQAKVKAGVNLKTVGEFDYCFTLDNVLSNDNNNSWSQINNTCKFSYTEGLDFSEADDDDPLLIEKQNVVRTAKVTFTNAANVTVTYTLPTASKRQDS